MIGKEFEQNRNILINQGKQRNEFPFSLTMLLIVVAVVVLGGTNDTLLAKNQIVVLGLFLIYSVTSYYISGKTLTNTTRSVMGQSYLVLIIFIATALYSIDVAMTFRICLYFLCYFLIWTFYLDLVHYIAFIDMIRIVGIVLAISIIVSAFLKESFVRLFSPWLTNESRVLQDIRYGQFSGLVGDRSFAAIAMCNGMFAEFSVLLCKQRISARNIVTLSVCLIAMFLTGKRITILMLLSGIAVTLIVSGNKRIKRISIATICVLAILAIGTMRYLPQARIVLNRVLNGIGDFSFNDRTRFWTVAEEMFIEKPITGWGLGSYLQYNLEQGTGIRQYAHNMYFQFAAEIGIIGTALLLALFVRIFVLTVNLTKCTAGINTSNEKLVCFFSLITQTGFFVYGVTGYPFYNLQQGFLYALCVSMILSVDATMIRLAHNK